MSYRSTHSNNSTMRKLPLKLSLAKMIAWPIVIIVSMVGCSPSDEFTYQVRVQAADTGKAISNARVIVEVPGETPVNDITDTTGLARVFVPSSLAGQPGVIIVEATDYAPYREHIDLIEGALPNLVLLEPCPTTGTPTPTGTKASVSTSTVSPTHTPTPIPTHTPTATEKPPTPTSSAIPDVSGKLAIPLMLGYEPKVYVTGFDGEGINGPKPVSQFGCQPMFCRDGNSIIVNGTAANLSGVFVMGSRGQNPEVLIDRDSAYWPAFSPDCSQVMFSEMTLDRRLHRRKSDGTILEVLANNRPILARNTLWSDDNRLVFWGCAVWLEQPGECGIWVTPADDIEPVRVVTTSGRPMDVKNGWLAYMSAEDGDWDIYLVSLDDGQSKNITNNNSQDGLAAIAPDGKHVAYVSNVSGNWALWSITIDGREKRKWFDIDPRRGAINLETWAEGRMSWAR
jgi:hypothetical protein